jgi:hypothetical protein
MSWASAADCLTHPGALDTQMSRESVQYPAKFAGRTNIHSAASTCDQRVLEPPAHRAHQHGKAVLYRRPAALVGDPPVHGWIYCAGGDHGHGQVTESRDNPFHANRRYGSVVLTSRPRKASVMLA